jgi:ADP-ribose pyrophosphatase
MEESRGPRGRHPLAWIPTTREPATDFVVFSVSRRRARHPQTGAERVFSIVECKDWVNVIALTKEGRIVLIEQFRHGTERMTLEIPGGEVEPDERSLEAAQRELREETGYTAPVWRHLGFVEPNPAIQTNRCDTWLALDAELTHGLALDPGEAIEVALRPLDEVPDLLRQGAITHGLVVAAFTYFLLQPSGDEG